MPKPEPIELTYAGTDGEPGAGITDYGLLLWPPGETEPVKIADGMREGNAAEVVRRWNAYPALVALLQEVVNAHATYREVASSRREELLRRIERAIAPPPEPEDDRETIAEGDYRYYQTPKE